MNIKDTLITIDTILKRKITIDQIMDDINLQKYKLISYNYDNMIPPGIDNQGNTCFHNSVMQLIYRIQELRNFLINDTIKGQYNDHSAIHGFVKLLKLMYDSRKNNIGDLKSITQERFKTMNIPACLAIIFYGEWYYSQEDAQQFMTGFFSRLMIDCPDNDLKNLNMKQICVKENGNNVIKKRFPDDDPRNFMTFNYETRSYPVIEIKDNEFRNVKNQIDEKQIDAYGQNNFNNIRKKYDYKNLVIKKGTPTNILQLKITDDNKTYHIEDLIKVAYNPFLLSNKTDLQLRHKRNENDNNKNYLYIETKNYFPNKYLVIQLWGNMGGYKINHGIKLETNGDINFEYYINDVKYIKIYELIGISYHSGGEIRGGHYYANIKYGNQWYVYNDSYVAKIITYNHSYQSVDNSATPYLVLYVEKTNEPIQYIDPSTIPNNIMEYLVDV